MFFPLLLMFPLQILAGTSTAQNQITIKTKLVKVNQKKTKDWPTPTPWPQTFLKRAGWLDEDTKLLTIKGSTPEFKNRKEIIKKLGEPNTSIKISEKELMIYEYSEAYFNSFNTEWKRWIRIQFRLDKAGKILDTKVYRGMNRFLYKS